jgi:hypothetical protein
MIAGSYINYPGPKNSNCGICLEPLDARVQVVMHQGQGELHAIHKTCMDIWIKRSAVCRICEIPIPVRSVEDIPIVRPTNTTLEKIGRIARIALSVAIYVAIEIAGFQAGVFVGETRNSNLV